MSSRSTRGRHSLADRLERFSAKAMVSCSYCQRRSLECRLSSLKERCTNCIRFGSRSCVPAEVPLPDFSKIDAEMERLEKEEEEAEAKLRVEDKIVAEASVRAQALRVRMEKVRTSRKQLRRKEKELFEKGLSSLEELEDLEARERLSNDAMLHNPAAADWLSEVDWEAMLQSQGEVGAAS